MGTHDGEDADAPLAGCCPSTDGGLQPVANLSTEFPWIASLRGRNAGQLRDRAGFTFAGWEDNTVVCSWRYVRVHILDRPNGRTFADALHAVRWPCVVLHEKPGRRGLPRMALYRLRPGMPATFRMVTVELQEDGRYLLVTAFPKLSFVHHHYEALRTSVLGTCAAYCLRQRDLHPGGRLPRPQRWSDATRLPPDPSCCEYELGCSTRGPFQPTISHDG